MSREVEVYEAMETAAEIMVEAGIISIDRIPGEKRLRVVTSDGREYSIGNYFPMCLDFDRRVQA